MDGVAVNGEYVTAPPWEWRENSVAITMVRISNESSAERGSMSKPFIEPRLLRASLGVS